MLNYTHIHTHTHTINKYRFDNDVDSFAGTAPTSLIEYREMTSSFKIPGAIESDSDDSDDSVPRRQKTSVANHSTRCSGDLNGLETVLEGNDEDEDFMSNNNNSEKNGMSYELVGRMGGLSKDESKGQEVEEQKQEQRQRGRHYFGSKLQRMFRLRFELLILYKY